jgi:hypothetical protein
VALAGGSGFRSGLCVLWHPPCLMDHQCRKNITRRRATPPKGKRKYFLQANGWR